MDLNSFDSPAAPPRVYLIHENHTWTKPLVEALERRGIPYTDWFVNQDRLDITKAPPQGVFYNRMSASSHTRDHRYAVEMTEPVLAWLEAHGRRVVNRRSALQLEVRKVEQYIGLQRIGLQTPRTLVANSKNHLLQAAASFAGEPFIVKPNRGGKGLGVQLFRNLESLETALPAMDSLDGLFLVQAYIQPHDRHIVRTEFIGGKFYYAVRVDASDGFELCPADACSLDNDSCVAESNAAPVDHKFEVLTDYRNPDLPLYERFLFENGIEIGAIEYVQNAAGDRFIYDVNINTNYNQAAEARHPEHPQGMDRIAAFLGRELERLTHQQALLAAS